MPHRYLNHRPRSPGDRTPANVARWCLASVGWAGVVVGQSARHPRQAFWHFWHIVNEPRQITVLVFFGYLILTWGGASALHNPPNTVENAAGVVAMFMLSAMFVGGGLIGAITCLPGWNWLERGGVLLSGFAALIYGGLAIYLGATSEGNRDLQVSMIFFSALMLAGRGFWIWNRPYAKRRDDNTTADG
ncbi:hypothetical protein ACHABQ_02860 [Nesterenkonia aurantiaca]|uniref:hypothetical protein n=1 Tax=Nesterenkonia aurantiaca TaxID=1436010 RepID=UPI003EE624F6